MFADEFQASLATLAGEISLVVVSGDLDLHTSERLRQAIDEATAVGADTVLLDLSGVSFVDSTALGVLVQRTKRLEGRGRTLAVVTNDPRTRRVFEVTGLDRVLNTYATLQNAISAAISEPAPATAAV